MTGLPRPGLLHDRSDHADGLLTAPDGGCGAGPTSIALGETGKT
jgi:hypothetical protein